MIVRYNIHYGLLFFMCNSKCAIPYILPFYSGISCKQKVVSSSIFLQSHSAKHGRLPYKASLKWW